MTERERKSEAEAESRVDVLLAGPREKNYKRKPLVRATNQTVVARLIRRK
jgi:hypothetical protein